MTQPGAGRVRYADLYGPHRGLHSGPYTAWDGRRVSALVLAMSLIGCTGPAGVRSKSANSPTRTKAVANTTTRTHHPAGAAPAARLTIQNETIEPSAIWQGQRSELRRKSESMSAEAYRSFIAERAAQLITDKVAEVLLYQRASLRLTPEMETKIGRFVDAEIRKIVTEDHDGIQRRYEKHLASEGLTIDHVRTRVRREFIIAGYLETELRPKVAEPTRAELTDAFYRNIDAWRRPGRRSMSLIDIRTSDQLPPDVSEPTRAQLEAARVEARSRIEAAWRELQEGADFADVARRYSGGARAADGGAWGWVNVESVRERFKPALDVLATLGRGQVSEVIPTPDGFFLVRCDHLDPGVEPDLQTVQPEIKDRHFRIAYNRLIGELVAELREKAGIEAADLGRFHAAVVVAAFEQPVASSRGTTTTGE